MSLLGLVGLKPLFMRVVRLYFAFARIAGVSRLA